MPSLLLSDSRPFFTLPSPFLCAICYSSFKINNFRSGLSNVFNLNFSELLAMTVLHSIAFSSLLFEDDYLIAFYVLQYLTRYFNTFHSRGANFYTATIINQ